MQARKKVAIFIDYTIRIPAFVKCYSEFKQFIFTLTQDTDMEDPIGEGDPRSYWVTELQKPGAEKFYMEVKVPEDDYSLRDDEFKKYFFTDEHFKTFVDERSYQLYMDCEVPQLKHIDYLNIAQVHLFDITLVDEYYSKRKIGNTFHFLSAKRIYPQSVVFLGEGQKLNEDNYIGIWNPKSDPEQNNKQGDSFIEWLKGLEKKINE